MIKRELKNNYIVAFINLCLFLIIFCFVYSFSRQFLAVLKLNQTVKLWVLFLAAAFPLIFYIFIADLNSVYKKIQYFFFRNTFLYLFFPALLIILSLIYFLAPKIFNLSFNKTIFLFLGGLTFSAHLIFAGRQTKTSGFTGFVNYIFIMDIIFILSLFFLAVYITIGYDFHLKEFLVSGTKNGFILLKSIIIQLIPG